VRDDKLRRDIRSAIAIAYELKRHTHVQSRDELARPLGDLEAELLRIEAKLGGEKKKELFPSILDFHVAKLDAIAQTADPVVADQIGALERSVQRIQRSLRRVGLGRPAAPSRALAIGAALALPYIFRIATRRRSLTPVFKLVLGVGAIAAAALKGRAQARSPAPSAG
jgi:hypothetical protein